VRGGLLGGVGGVVLCGGQRGILGMMRDVWCWGFSGRSPWYWGGFCMHSENSAMATVTSDYILS
jgi:hypothetical protein